MAHSLQPRAESAVDYQLHFSAGLFFQSLAFLVTNVVALVLYHLEEYASVAPLLVVLSLGFFLEWPGELRRKMLERALDWRRLRLLHALGLLLHRPDRPAIPDRRPVGRHDVEDPHGAA